MSTHDAVRADIDPILSGAIHSALDGVLRALVLEPLGGDRFRVVGEPGRFDRVFGGQTIAQALAGAYETVEEKAAHSLHAYFVEAGVPGEMLVVEVERVRDGRSISTRRATVLQGERTLLTLLASFHDNPSQPERADVAPAVERPEELPLLQDLIRELLPELPEQAQHVRTWVDRPPPLELRVKEAMRFMGGPSGDGARSFWMRLPRDVGDDPVRHSLLFAYATDFFLLDMAFRFYPSVSPPVGFTAFSIDHAVWIHRPMRFERWHLYTQEALAISGHRGLVKGAIHDENGRLVANVMQEVLVRPPSRPVP